MRNRLVATAAVALAFSLAIVASLRVVDASGEFMLIYTEQGGAKRVYKSGAEVEYLSGATVDAQSGSTVTLAGTNTLSGATTLSGAITQSGGTTLSGANTLGGTNTFSGANTVNSAGSFGFASGSTLNIIGKLQIPSGTTANVSGTFQADSGGKIDLASGAELNVKAGSYLRVKSGATAEVESGGFLQVPTGATLNVSGTQTVQSGGVLTAATGSTTNVSGTGAIWGATAVKQDGSLTFAAGSKVVYNVQSKAANYTVLASEAGTVFIATAADVVFELPATAAGLRYTFVFKVPSGGTGGQIGPVAADKIMGDGVTSADDKNIINTGATDREGDSIEVIADGADGWFIITKSGTFAREG